MADSIEFELLRSLPRPEDKILNDTHGHLLGDKLLKDFCTLIKNGLRQNDFFGRIGGEEFIVVTPETGKNGAVTLTRKLLDSVHNFQFHGKMQTVTGVSFSAGISTYPDDGKEAQELIRIADDTMYRVKVQGKKDVLGAG